MNGLIRWGVPLGLFWTQVMLTAWVYETRLPDTAKVMSSSLVAVLWGAPALSLGAFLSIRLTTRGPSSPLGEALVSAVMGFGLLLHLSLLGDALDVLPSVRRTVPWLLGLLLTVLGLGFRQLPWGDSMGIRLGPCLQSEARWRRLHQRAGWGMVLLGGALPWLSLPIWD